MPNYDYKCSSCDHAFETFQKITDAHLKECPKCFREALVRGIGGGKTRFQFKGSGFYITDCKDNSSCKCD